MLLAISTSVNRHQSKISSQQNTLPRITILIYNVILNTMTTRQRASSMLHVPVSILVLNETNHVEHFKLLL